MRTVKVLSLVLCFLFVSIIPLAALSAEETVSDTLKKANSLYQAGNYKDAFAEFSKAFLKEPLQLSTFDSDFRNSVRCLNNLGDIEQFDTLAEELAKLHPSEPFVLRTLANAYNESNHFGYIVAGQFYRGNKRGGGRMVDSSDRDRVRSLQLYFQALALKDKVTDNYTKADFFRGFANVLSRGSDPSRAWMLQALTDFSALPDYADYQYSYRNSYSGSQTGAPVNEDGTPLFFSIPSSYETAKNDGERWRWSLSQLLEYNPAAADEIAYNFANFLRAQFDVQTLQTFGYIPPVEDEDTKKNESGSYAVHTLSETETIARLANGVKRFTLPDQFNFIRIYQRLADSAEKKSESPYAENALDQLSQLFEDRRQYDRAAEYWKLNIRYHGPGYSNHRQLRLNQIVGAWGRFEAVQDQEYKSPTTVDYVYRNGASVQFEAFEVKVDKLVEDAKAYLKNNPSDVTWDRIQLENIGYRLVQANQSEYVGKKAATWTQALTPDPRHFDRRITIRTPLEKPGAYLINATISGGNRNTIVLWVHDTVILRKTLDKGIYFYLADAHSGKPLSNTDVNFFGYRRQEKKNPGVLSRAFNNLYEVVTTEVTRKTDEKGQIILGQGQLDNQYSWLTSTRSASGNVAYQGFNSIWFSSYYDHEYNQTKSFVITDRPVYRPGNPVKFKIWVRNAKYDQDDISNYANQKFTVELRDPKGDSISTLTLDSDAYAGIEGQFELKKDSTLGVYTVSLVGYGSQSGTFRVEEYKKPEFEVKVDAPSDPIMLGEKIKIGIDARYYFGSPVTEATVKYKVTRNDYSARWFPVGIWDWFYGPGYWWFAYDYVWYPGWRHWGCFRPHPFWWNAPVNPPELALEREAKIGPDGKLNFELDTIFAKELHPDEDHKYAISVEVVDQSRRSIFGTGEVLVARKPFKVYAWVDRGYYRKGDTIQANFSAQTLDNKPVEGAGKLKLFSISYKEGTPVETLVLDQSLPSDAQGRAHLQLTAANPGQYRLAYTVTDKAAHTIEGAYIFNVVGSASSDASFRFNEIELIPDKREYKAGERVNLMINTNRVDSTVLYFVRPANGIYLAPEILDLEGKSTIKEILIGKKDMPNFFVEAVTISGGRIYSESKEIIVPPESRVLTLEVEASKEEYKPGEEATVNFKLTDSNGKPFVGSTALTVYDKAVEYISGGSNVPEIKEYFWKWRRTHNPSSTSNVDGWSYPVNYASDLVMNAIGTFGNLVANDQESDGVGDKKKNAELRGYDKDSGRRDMPMRAGRMMAVGSVAKAEGGAMMDSLSAAAPASMEMLDEKAESPISQSLTVAANVEATVRKEFADTAFWAATVNTDADGRGSVRFKMPENLTNWKIKTWAMGHGTKVGQAEIDVVTKKNLIVRLQAPRFFVEKDEVVLSANVHNYLKSAKTVTARLEFTGDNLELLDAPEQKLTLEPGVDKRLDWRVRVKKEGEAVIRALALSDEESDAVEMRFPVFVHGMLKTDSFSGLISPTKESASFEIKVPAERRPDQSLLEIRYSPSLAAAMVDALPYLVGYPYGCTEQTLNRFIPTVITNKTLRDMGLNLEQIKLKRTNLNAQEIGDDKERAKQWQRYDHNPVFDQEEVDRMLAAGILRLQAMQLSDGGWGWFSGWGEQSWPHTTALVIHGLQIAKESGLAVPEDMLSRGVSWLKYYQESEIQKLKNAKSKTEPWREYADNIDAFVYMVLVDAGERNSDMLEFLYRDRLKLAVYTQAMFGLALHKQEQKEKLAIVLKNLSQYVVQDEENQTAYLKLPENNYWWYWYGSEYEAHSYYLKLISRTDPKGSLAPRLVKYLLNNRKNATYWNSTRDTALVVEAFADYLKATGETKPELHVEIFIDGKKFKEAQITAENLFTFDNKAILQGAALESGTHKIEFRKKGKGPLYFNAYLTNFTLEDRISRAGLEVKVNRKFYKLTRKEATALAEGSRGQAVTQNVEKYQRNEIADLSMLKSGDLIEIELEIDSKNDYEYILFEDMKAAGFEPVEVRSGYNGNDLGAYVEFHDERVSFFVRSLARGKHSVSYRLKAEIPGKFSALPARAYAMYAPELKGNSDEFKVQIED